MEGGYHRLKACRNSGDPGGSRSRSDLNSYGHRLYDNNQCNEIDVFKNRIEIHTTGGFPKGHNPEEFLDGNKKAIRRNKLIIGVLYYSDDMENFATGLKRIKDLCDEAGCEVEFRMEQNDFVVTFYRNLREEWSKGKNYDRSSTTKRLPRPVKLLKILCEMIRLFLQLLLLNYWGYP